MPDPPSSPTKSPPHHQEPPPRRSRTPHPHDPDLAPIWQNFQTSPTPRQAPRATRRPAPKSPLAGDQPTRRDAGLSPGQRRRRKKNGSWFLERGRSFSLCSYCLSWLVWIHALDDALSLLLSTVIKYPHSKRIVGLGIEKSYVRSGNGNLCERIALLKLCSGSSCVLVHLFHFKEIPFSLAKFLNLSCVTFVGFTIKQDIADIEREFGIVCRSAILIDPVFALRLSSEFESICRPESVVFGDWGAITLTEEQIRCAAFDVRGYFCVANFIFDHFSPYSEGNICFFRL